MTWYCPPVIWLSFRVGVVGCVDLCWVVYACDLGVDVGTAGRDCGGVERAWRLRRCRPGWS